MRSGFRYLVGQAIPSPSVPTLTPAKAGGGNHPGHHPAATRASELKLAGSANRQAQVNFAFSCFSPAFGRGLGGGFVCISVAVLAPSLGSPSLRANARSAGWDLREGWGRVKGLK